MSWRRIVEDFDVDRSVACPRFRQLETGHIDSTLERVRKSGIHTPNNRSAGRNDKRVVWSPIVVCRHRHGQIAREIDHLHGGHVDVLRDRQTTGPRNCVRTEILFPVRFYRDVARDLLPVAVVVQCQYNRDAQTTKTKPKNRKHGKHWSTLTGWKF